MKKLDEVIKALECCIDPELHCDTDCPYEDRCEGQEDMNADALHYLKDYKRVQTKIEKIALGNIEDTLDKLDNKPLSWDELCAMEGKPVWVEEKYSFGNEWHGTWEVICSVWDNEWDDDPYLSMTNEEYRHKDDMGERWQAYRKEREA